MTQRGSRRAQTFFDGGDDLLCRDLLAEAADKAGAEMWAYCLMPNHVHLIVVPHQRDGLRRTFANAPDMPAQCRLWGSDRVCRKQRKFQR